MRKLLSSLLSVVLCVQFVLASQGSEKLYDCLRKDSATLSSTYFDGYYTNKQLANFNLEILRASNRGLYCRIFILI
jgi:hypothetical protein